MKKRVLGLMPVIASVLTAALMFYLATTQEPQRDDPKPGTAYVELLGPEGQAVVNVEQGALIRVRLSTAGFTHALVVRVDKERHLEPLWPAPGESDALPPGPVVILPASFPAPGDSVAVHAFFSNQPIDPAQVGAALEQAIADDKGWPPEVKPPPLPGLTAASRRLYLAR